MAEQGPSTSKPALNTNYVPDTNVFGIPCRFGGSKLPTNGDVLRYIFFLYNQKFQEERKSQSFESFSNIVAKDLQEIWQKTYIPVIQGLSIVRKINKLIELYQVAKKHRERQGYINLQKKKDKLFDIARCRCEMNDSRCACQTQDKIPSSQLHFILDHRGERKLSLEDFVSVETEQEDSLMIYMSNSERMETATGSEYFPHTTDSSNEENPPQAKRKYLTGYSYPKLATECDRYGISDRALASAVLQDLETKDEHGDLIKINKSKLRRDRERNRTRILRQNQDTSVLKAFSFDSRKDRTYTTVTTEDNKKHPRFVQETHITILKEPNSVFLGYAVSGNYRCKRNS